MRDLAFLLLLQCTIVWVSDITPEECCGVSSVSYRVTYDCSNCGLNTIPRNISTNVTTAILRNNSIQSLEGSPFKDLSLLEYLDLSMNNITVFDQAAFKGLCSLKTLDITSNIDSVCIFPAGLFSPLEQLEFLHLGAVFKPGQTASPNWINSINPGLRSLSLTVSQYYIFTEEFSRFSRLYHLKVSGGVLTNITSDTFFVFANSSIKVLEVRKCYLEFVTADAFTMLKHLETLNLSCNRYLDFKSIFAAVKNLPSRSLHTLILDNTGRKTINRLSTDLFDSNSFSNLRRLSVKYTKIASFDVKVLTKIPRLEYFSGSFNYIMQSTPSNFKKALVLAVRLLNNMNLTALDLSYYGNSVVTSHLFKCKYCDTQIENEEFFRRPPPYISPPTIDREVGNEVIDDDIINSSSLEHFGIINLPLSLLYIYAKGTALMVTPRHVTFHVNGNNLLYLDVSHSQMNILPRPVGNLPRLQGFDANSCNIGTVTPGALSNVSNLVYIDLSKNSLTSDGIEALIRNNTKIKYLDLSYNLLHTVDNISWLFQLISLEVLNLSSNRLTEINMDFSRNQNLQFLDLSNCSLTSLSDETIKGLDSLHKQSLGLFQVDLRGNMWVCDCQTLSFLNWVSSTEVNIIDKNSLTCKYQTSKVERTSFNISQLKSSCRSTALSPGTVVAVPCILIFANLIAIVLSYHYRWTLKCKFYLLRRRLRMFVMARNPVAEPLIVLDRETYYDAYVSYNGHEDYVWVEDSLFPKVEEEWNLKLCIGQRDFERGVPIAENTCQAINRSKVTILIITPSFVKCTWCDFEMHMALARGHKHLIIVYKEEIDLELTSTTLRTLMRVNNYIEYSENPDGQAMFWGKLYDALMSGRCVDNPLQTQYV